MEDRRNVHRDKASILIKMAQAAEDSTLRRRKVSTSISYSTGQKLEQDLHAFGANLQEQAAGLTGKTTNSNSSVEKSKPTPTLDDRESLQRCIQSIMTAVYQIQEHSHLNFQCKFSLEYCSICLNFTSMFCLLAFRESGKLLNLIEYMYGVYSLSIILPQINSIHTHTQYNSIINSRTPLL